MIWPVSMMESIALNSLICPFSSILFSKGVSKFKRLSSSACWIIQFFLNKNFLVDFDREALHPNLWKIKHFLIIKQGKIRKKMSDWIRNDLSNHFGHKYFLIIGKNQKDKRSLEWTNRILPNKASLSLFMVYKLL